METVLYVIKSIGVIAFIVIFAWLFVGTLALFPFQKSIAELHPIGSDYNFDTLMKHIVTWPYMLYKIYKLKGA